MKRLKIRIFQDGYVQTETLGIKGKKCEDYIPLCEKILQQRVVEQDYTDEYYEEIQENTEIEMEYAKI